MGLKKAPKENITLCLILIQEGSERGLVGLGGSIVGEAGESFPLIFKGANEILYWLGGIVGADKREELIYLLYERERSFGIIFGLEICPNFMGILFSAKLAEDRSRHKLHQSIKRLHAQDGIGLLFREVCIVWEYCPFYHNLTITHTAKDNFDLVGPILVVLMASGAIDLVNVVGLNLQVFCKTDKIRFFDLGREGVGGGGFAGHFFFAFERGELGIGNGVLVLS